MPSTGGLMPQGAARRLGTDRRHRNALPGQAGKTVAANGKYRLNPEGLDLNAKFELQRGLTGYQSAVVSPKLKLSGADTAGRHTAVFPRRGSAGLWEAVLGWRRGRPAPLPALLARRGRRGWGRRYRTGGQEAFQRRERALHSPAGRAGTR